MTVVSIDQPNANFPSSLNPKPPTSDTTGTLIKPNACCTNGQRSNDASFDERFDVRLLPIAIKPAGVCPTCGALDASMFSGPPDKVAGIFSIDRGHIAANFFTEDATQRAALWHFVDSGKTETKKQVLAPGLALDLVSSSNSICLVLTEGADISKVCLNRSDSKKINILLGNTPLDDMLLLNRGVTKDHVDSHFGLFYQPGYLKDIDKTPIPQDTPPTKHGTGTNCPPLFVAVQ
jgi:hypothetical protein